MQNDLQVWQLILDASWMVKMVMLILLAASVSSWMIIFRKRMALAAAEKGANAFEERFWSGTDLTQLYETVSRNNTVMVWSRFLNPGSKNLPVCVSRGV